MTFLRAERGTAAQEGFQRTLGVARAGSALVIGEASWPAKSLGSDRIWKGQDRQEPMLEPILAGPLTFLLSTFTSKLARVV
jgi:hypothetical protein